MLSQHERELEVISMTNVFVETTLKTAGRHYSDILSIEVKHFERKGIIIPDIKITFKKN